MPDRETEEQAIAYAKALTMPQEIREVVNQVELALQAGAIDRVDRDNLIKAANSHMEYHPPGTETRERLLEYASDLKQALAEAIDLETRTRNFKEWANNFPEELEPSADDFRRTASINALERQQEAAIPQPDPVVSKLSNEQIIAGLWRAANAPLTEKELAIKERAAALAETKTPEPTLDAERQRRHQQRI